MAYTTATPEGARDLLAPPKKKKTAALNCYIELNSFLNQFFTIFCSASASTERYFK
jgi:hypothetical protein